MPNPWNSLEICKLIVSTLTPFFVIIVGFILNRNIKRLEKTHWTNQKIIEKRLMIYDKVVPLLNDLLCFHCYVGNWKDISPRNVINHKRILDKEMNVYSPLFNTDIMRTYNIFIDNYYETNTGWGKDAKIKSLYPRRKEFNTNWNDEDIDLFSISYKKDIKESKREERDYISLKKEVYIKLIDQLSDSLEIMKSNVYCDIKNPSINFHGN